MKKLITVIAAVFGGPGQAEQTLTDVLTALEAHLANKRPDYAALLRPPLSADAIAMLEKQHNVALPDDVKTLYAWHDGQDPQSSSSLAGNLMFQPLSEVLRDKEEADSMIGYDFELENWWHPSWLPLFHNGGGDSLVVDLAGVHTGNKGQMLTFYHDWDYRPIEAHSLLAYMQGVLAYYATTPQELIEEPFDLEAHLPETGQSFKASGTAHPLK